MANATILIVDDDRSHRAYTAEVLRRNLACSAEEAGGGKEAIARLMDMKNSPVDLVLLDLTMPQVGGVEVLTRIRETFPALPVIIVTGHSEISEAVALMRRGANDFITKPFTSERLMLSITQHLTIRALSNEVARLTRREEGYGRFSDLIGAETGLQAAVALAKRAASSAIPVFITGESGTGKELLARAIHGESPRAGKPFIAVNCGAIPEHLVESTLFGHEKGSFTGAIAREIGKFREAEGGTLFLDEIGELKPGAQTKLLRVLQQKDIEPVGAGKPVRVNVRIVSATNRNLAEDAANGRFREDLYYRLNVLLVRMPPLRERRGDIAALAHFMIARFAATENKAPKRISEDGLEWLAAQDWPGNVRELENLLYRAVVLTDAESFTARDFGALKAGELKAPNHTGSYVTLLTDDGRAKTWDELESEIISAALARSGGNVAVAARQLNMGQSTLYKKLTVNVA